ncbi:oxidoreductase [Nocardia sp. 348MFTsu5.1]|uniref:oxidoreductase n=1 Tax=Nocardia sp. 348MFTsu5.1 TaxID=1172185 RepID=UPI00037F003A|nr:oxidoreductase [Nocardia sp. 348MFTsu5.1]
MGWTLDDIPDQTGRTFVVTGANGGLGEYITSALAGRGATVVMACRDTSKAGRLATRIDGDLEVAHLDLGDLSSVRAFADQVGPCDVLINNAGVMNTPFRLTVDGFETQFGVNHLGHFALTGLLLDKVADRVVTVASLAHRQTPTLHIDDLNYENRRYVRAVAYGQSKLANLMFARELQRRLQAAGSKKRSYAVHPGVSSTELFSHTETFIDKLARPATRLVGHHPRKAAQSTIFAATEADADPRVYWGPTRLMGMRGPVGESPSTGLSKDVELAAQLWTASEKLTGVTYPV